MSFSLPTIPILSGSGSSVAEPFQFEKRKGGISRELQRHQRHCILSERPRQSSTISEYDDLTEAQLISREYSITSSESTSTTNYIHPACHKYSGSSTSVSGSKLGRVFFTFEKMLSDWSGESGGSTVRTLLTGVPSAGKSTFRQSLLRYFGHQDKKQHQHALRDLDQNSMASSGMSSHHAHEGGGGGSGGSAQTTNVKLCERDFVDLMFKRILKSEYEWNEKSVRVQCVEVEKAGGGGDKGGADRGGGDHSRRHSADQQNKLYDHLDCATILIDASNPGASQEEFGERNFQHCYQQMARALPLVVVYNFKQQNNFSSSHLTNETHQGQHHQNPSGSSSTPTPAETFSASCRQSKLELRKMIDYERLIMSAEYQVLEVVVPNLTDQTSIASILSAIVRQGTLRKCLDCGPNPKIVSEDDLVHR